MLLETLWASLYSSMTMSITITVLAGGFYLIGRAIFNLLKIPTEASSIAIASGIATVSFFGWYAYRFDISLSAFVLGIFFLATTLLLLTLRKCWKIGHINCLSSFFTLSFFALAFSVQSLIAFNTTNNPIGAMGNNDIYDWSILAEHLLGMPGYDNVFTGNGESAQQHRIDSFGTFFIIAICAKFIGTSSLEASTIFTIFCLSLIGLSIFDIVKKMFCFKNGISFGIALLVSAGSFFFYIAYNSFYGQLLATFFYLTTINSLLHIAISNNKSVPLKFVERVALPLFSLIGILIVYQSGFFVFMVFSAAFCIIYSIFGNSNNYKFALITQRTRLLLIPLFVGIFLAIILLPELALHTVQRTIAVKGSLDGWPLPLISPAYLFSIPVSSAFPSLLGEPIQYVFALIGMGFIFVFAYLAVKKHSAEIAAIFLVLITFFCLSITAYILAFYLKGGIYQVWKLAAFVVLPMSFVFYVSCILIFQYSTISSVLIKKLLVPVIICGCLVVLIITPSKLELKSISFTIEQFKATKRILLNNGIENVVLDAMGYSETMMAFNILSNNFKLFPLVRTYVQPINRSLVQKLNTEKTRVLVNSECYFGNIGQNNHNEYEIIQLDEMINGGKKYFFGSAGINCSYNQAVRLLAGFSVIEAWGVWTEGNNASIQIDIPPTMAGKELELIFDVHPFGTNQSVAVKVDGYSQNWAIKQATKLYLIVPPKSTNQKQLTLDFYIDHPISPNSVNHALSDTRLLGLGFVSLSVTTVH